MRRQLAEGTYDIEEHLDTALEKALAALAVRTAHAKVASKASQKKAQESDTQLDASAGMSTVEYAEAQKPTHVTITNDTENRTLTHKIRQGCTMKTKSKTNRKELFQTVDDSARVARLETVPLRPTSGKKAGQETSHCGVRTVGRPPVLTHNQIAERARAIWIERGRVAGEDERNWQEAEAQLRREMGLEPPNL